MIIANTMPRGLKETSSQLVISFGLTETGPNTFTSERIDLQLNALDNEVFVITGAKLDLECPDVFSGLGNVRTANFVSLSKQDISNANFRDLANTSVFATADIQIVSDVGPAGTVFASIQENSCDTPVEMEYLDIIATPDFFVNINGVGNTQTMSVSGKLYGYRAKADSATYASLVQSELLSS